jgi:hypothetical protein
VYLQVARVAVGDVVEGETWEWIKEEVREGASGGRGEHRDIEWQQRVASRGHAPA